MVRHTMVVVVSLAALWLAGCRVDLRELRPLHATLPPSPDRELAAAATTDNVLTVATLEPSGEDKYVLRVVNFHRPNAEVSHREIRLKGILGPGDVRVFDRNNRTYVGWLEDAHRLCLAVLGRGPLRREILLEDPDAYLGDWWIVGRGPRTRLLVQKQELFKRTGKKEKFLYAYTFTQNEASFVEKISLEEKGHSSCEVACASGKERIIVWQVQQSRKHIDVIKDPGAVGLDVEILRAGVWQEGRGVLWESRYVGNDPLLLSVDSKNGAACAVKEWKGAQKGSTIALLLMLESTKLIPLGTSDRLGLRVQLVWLGGPDVCWAVLLRNPGGDIVVQWFDAEVRPINSVVLGRVRKNVLGRLLTAGKDGATNIVTLRKDGIDLRTFIPAAN